MNEFQQKAEALPYVAPVVPDTLPVEEVLVRGCEEPPVAQCDVLQRAAKEELLRVAEGE